jgi:NAD(P)H dehydrogenase (quinone)
LGRRVIAHLLNTHRVAPSQIVAATRDPNKLSDVAARGIELRRADFEDPASLQAAVRRGGSRTADLDGRAG